MSSDAIQPYAHPTNPNIERDMMAARYAVQVVPTKNESFNPFVLFLMLESVVIMKKFRDVNAGHAWSSQEIANCFHVSVIMSWWLGHGHNYFS